MDSEDEAHARLLRTLTRSRPTPLQAASATLHAAALQSCQSAVPHVGHLSSTLSALRLPEPVTLHPTAHSANTQSIPRVKPPTILHVHAPAHAPHFPHHLHCRERYLPLGSHTDAAARVAASLRDAVASRDPVSLIVVHLEPGRTLLPALPVAHALAHRFDARVHVTGPGCLAALLAKGLAAHSVGLDLGAALGLRGCGYVTFGVDGVEYGDALLPFAVCMRYALDRFPVEAMERVLNAVARVVEGLSDALYRVEELCMVEVLADGEARIRYAGEVAKEVERVAVARDDTGLLELVDRLRISATSALRRRRAPQEGAVKRLCELLIRVAREYELARLARSAFVARLRQCEHVEVLPGTGLVLCVLAVVPLGHVPPAGRWRTDEDARGVVRECTKRFVEDGGGLDVAVVTGEDDDSRAVVSPRLPCEMAEGVDGGLMAEECERLAKELAFDEERARLWGVRVAEDVVRRVVNVVEGIVVADGEDVGRKVEDVEERERGPDGTVEVVEEVDRQDEGESAPKVEGHVAKLKNGGDGAYAGSTGERSLEREKRGEELEEHGEPHEAETEVERSSQNGYARPKSRPGLWGLIFGDRNSDDTESDEDSEDVEGKQLEDDYFRP